jgi:hypothetical protein
MGKTLKYVSEFTFPSSNSKPMASGYAKGGMAMGGMKASKPMPSPAPGSGMVYSKKENTAKTLLPDGKGAPMPHARGTVNMAKGGMAKGGMNCGMAKGGKVPMEKWEASKEDLQQDKKLAAKHGMSLEAWEKSSMDKKHDTQQSMKGLAKGGMAKVGKVMGEFKSGELHSGSKSGPVVKSRKQAVAIGMSEARKAMKK